MKGLFIIGALLTQPAAAGDWLHLTQADGLPAGQVRTILAAETGEVWFGIRGKGLATYDNGRWSYATADDGLLSNGAAAMAESQGKLWAAGPGGYSVRDSGRWQGFSDLGGRTTRVVFSITPSRDGKSLWFGANGFAARMDEQEWTFVEPADGLPHRVVHQVWVDRKGAAWFACRRGLARMEGGSLEVFRPEVNFRSIVEDGQGRLWFGTGGQGVLQFSNGDWKEHLAGTTALPSWVDAQGRIWSRTEGDGAYRYDGRSWVRFTKADGLLSDVVFAIAGAKDGSIWFGTDQGASRYSPSSQD